MPAYLTKTAQRDKFIEMSGLKGSEKMITAKRKTVYEKRAKHTGTIGHEGKGKVYNLYCLQKTYNYIEKIRERRAATSEEKLPTKAIEVESVAVVTKATEKER